MSKLSDIVIQAEENLSDESETLSIPDQVYEEAIIDEARRILMSRKEEQEEVDLD